MELTYSKSANGFPDRADGKDRGSERGTENIRPDEMGVEDEQHQELSGGNNTEGIGIQPLISDDVKKEKKLADKSQAVNFRITDDALGVGGAKEKFKTNIEAIKTLELIESENRTATPEEQQILSKYVGWGGLADAFDESKANWVSEYQELKELLSDAEYAQARESTLNAHYTSPVIIRSIYEALHPIKTRIVYCKDKDRTKVEDLTEFDFLGYTFKAVYIKCRDGKIRHNFIASVSKTSSKNFRDKIKTMEVHKMTVCKIDIIAETLNPLIRGWMNYFGKFNPSAMRGTLQYIERRLVKWAMCKYKNFRGRRRRAEKWLYTVRQREPGLFAHWSNLYSYC